MRLRFTIVLLYCTLWQLPLLKAIDIDSLKIALNKESNDSIKVLQYNLLAKHVRNTNLAEALIYAKESYMLANKIKYYDGAATASDIIGVIYLNNANYKQALRHHLIAINLFEKTGNQKGIAFAYNNMGAVYNYLKDYKKAEQFYLKSYRIKEQQNLRKELSSTLINLGNVKMYQDSLDACIAYYEQALKNSITFNDSNNISICLTNLGEAYYDKKDWQLARIWYMSALPIVEQMKYSGLIAQCYFGLAKIHDEIKIYPEAELYYLKALDICKDQGLRRIQLNIFKSLAKHYEITGNLNQAITLYKNYISLNDTIYSNDLARQIKEMEVLFEVERKNKQIELLNKDKAITDAQLANEHLLRNVLTGSIALVILIMLFLLRNVLLKQRINKVLADKNTEISIQQEEIARQNEQLQSFNADLQKENIYTKFEVLKNTVNPHFLFNSLAALSALMVKNKDEAQQYMSKFARMYRKLLEKEQRNVIPVNEEIEFVEEYISLQNVRFGGMIKWRFQLANITSLVIPPFTLQLLVENAIKHNEVSDLKPLQLLLTENTDYLILTNNLNPKLFEEHSTGIGQKNISERFQLISEKEPKFESTETEYIAYLPKLKAT